MSIPDHQEQQPYEEQPTQRGKGESTVYQRKDGRWAVRFVGETGKRKIYYCKTRSEAEERLRQALYEQKQSYQEGSSKREENSR